MKPYYLLVKVLDDYGVPLNIDDLVKDLRDTRGLDVQITIMQPAITETLLHEDSDRGDNDNDDGQQEDN